LSLSGRFAGRGASGSGRPRKSGEGSHGIRIESPAPVRILVVDDDAVLRDVFADLIRGLGYQVNVVTDAGEALGRVRNEGFDVLVTDIVLPGMDGWRCCGSWR
jgi:CheY-like chemotaxis protein